MQAQLPGEFAGRGVSKQRAMAREIRLSSRQKKALNECSRYPEVTISTAKKKPAERTQIGFSGSPSWTHIELFACRLHER
jgi:hypothetical protein